jgi:hypothetical protein
VRDRALELRDAGCLSAATAASTLVTPQPLRAILTAGLICGVLDGLCAIGLSLLFGNGPVRMLQGIASGVLGSSAFKGGAGAAALGLALHFVIAFGASAVYYSASRVLPVLIARATLSGVLYGFAVHLFMQFVVIPLSAIGGRPFVLQSFVLLAVVHMIVVGPSIALTIRHFSRD